MSRIVQSVVCSVAIVAASVLIVDASVARACSQIPARARREILPESGSEGVPLNTEVRALYGVLADGLNDLRVRPVGGEPVAVTVHVVPSGSLDAFGAWVVARPDVPLEPLTTYEVLDRVGPRCESLSCIGDEHAVVATFTTGESNDSKAPVFAGLREIERSPEWCTRGGGCCLQGDATALVLVHDDVHDGPTGSVRYNLYVDGILRVSYGQAHMTGSALCPGTTGRPLASFAMESGALTLRAVDLAGNEDTNEIAIAVTPRCGDAGASCAVASSSRPDGAFAIVVALGAIGMCVARRGRQRRA